MKLLLLAVLVCFEWTAQAAPKKFFNGLDHKIKPRISFGQTAKPGEFPYMVFLSDDDGFLYGGGVLVSNEFVLTTADNVESYTDAGEVVLRLGEFNWEEEDDNIVLGHVHHMVQHPDFDSSTLSNNIALLHMHRGVNFTDRVKAACVSRQNSNELVGQKAVMTGWGITENFQMSKTLQKMEAEVISFDDCKKSLDQSDAEGLVSDGVLCTKADKEEFCSGDQGGPLVVQQNNENRLIGIASWILSCNEGQYPGIYVDVSKYESWLRNQAHGFGSVQFCE